MGEMILEAINLKKLFVEGEDCVKAIDDVSVSIKQGEFIAIMGESGSGKTTLLNCCSTMIRPDSGKLLIEGKEVDFYNPHTIQMLRRDKIGFIFQDYNLLDVLTIEENISMPLVIKKERKKDIDNIVNQIAAQLGISEILSKYPNQISGGQKQRCACARALVTNPKIIFADEPTGALDSKNAQSFLELLDELNRNLNVTILMATHNITAAYHTKRVIFIKDGKIQSEIVKQNETKFQDEILKNIAKI